MKTKDYLPILLALFVFTFLGLNSESLGNEYRIHSRGNLWETVWDNGLIGSEVAPYATNPSMDWPGGPLELDKLTQRSYLKKGGIWIAGMDTAGTIFFDECGPYATGQDGTPGTWTTISMELTREENFNCTPSFDYTKPEEIITAKWTTSSGITVTRKSMSWSYPGKYWAYPGYDNFIIMDYVFKNTGDVDGDAVPDIQRDYRDVYLGFVYLIQPSSQDKWIHGWGDSYLEADDNVGYDETRGLLYAYDSIPPAGGLEDYGNLYEEEITTPGYAGFAKLYADPASDGSNQPSTVFYAQSLDRAYSLSLGKEFLYAILNGDSIAVYMPDTNIQLAPILMQGYGPYDLEFGDSLRIVIVESVYGISLTYCNIGADGQKFLGDGLRYLKRSIDKAQECFDNSYVVYDLPPPAPDSVGLAIKTIPGTIKVPIEISWADEFDDWVNPVTSEEDLVGYRIYRSDKAFIGPYTLVREIEKRDDQYWDSENMRYAFDDTTVEFGYGYFYAVSSFNADGYESGLTNRNIETVYAIRPPSTSLDVKVAPNPFRRISGWPLAGDEYKIMFYNLPERCTIRIYTVSGDLVREIEHDDPNSGCEFWDQFTQARLRVASGIYLFTVESAIGYAKGTIVIIK